MRIGKLLVIALVLVAAPQLAYATHVPGSAEKVQYDSTLTPGTAVTGTIGWAAPIDGYDWYCFDATKGQKVTLTVKRTSGDLKMSADGNLELKASGDLKMEATGNASLKGAAATVEGQGEAKLKAPSVSLAGNTQFSPS